MPAFVVSAAEAGGTVLEVLRARLGLSRARARRLLNGRRVRLGGVPCQNPARRVRRGQRLDVLDEHRGPERKSDDLVIRHLDAQVVVVEKPPGLTTMRHAEEAAEFGARARRFLPSTLADRLAAQLARQHPGKRFTVRAVHRLDKDTSGLVVFALTREAEGRLGRQLRAHTMARRYLAVVRGRARPGRIESYLARDRGDHRRGSSADPAQGKRAITHVRVLEDLGDYTLVECRLETGRTHQVRIHLAESGTPLCGERVYDRTVHGKPLPDPSGAPRLALHAAQLGFEHPSTGQWMAWRSPLPGDLAALVRRLRQGKQH